VQRLHGLELLGNYLLFSYLGTERDEANEASLIHTRCTAGAQHRPAPSHGLDCRLTSVPYQGYIHATPENTAYRPIRALGADRNSVAGRSLPTKIWEIQPGVGQRGGAANAGTQRARFGTCLRSWNAGGLVV
jgi:hypothetical protein